jgi:hypothetical protein
MKSFYSSISIFDLEPKIEKIDNQLPIFFFTVKVSFLARDRERTVPMYIPDIYQNDRDKKLNQNAHDHAPKTKLSL